LLVAAVELATTVGAAVQGVFGMGVALLFQLGLLTR
jgi:hypothetical protein